MSRADMRCDLRVSDGAEAGRAWRTAKPNCAFRSTCVRACMFWNLLFLRDALPDASKGASADWTRGRYLADALGHCAECHTPRGDVRAARTSRSAAGCGARPGRGAGHHAARAGGARLDGADLQTFFATGIAPQGSAFGEMHPVVMLSTQYLTPRRPARASSTYLLGDTPPTPKPCSAGVRRRRPTRRRPQPVSRRVRGLPRTRGRRKAARRGIDARQFDAARAERAQPARGDARRHRSAALPGHESMQPMPGFATTSQRRRNRTTRELPARDVGRSGSERVSRGRRVAALKAEAKANALPLRRSDAQRLRGSEAQRLRGSELRGSDAQTAAPFAAICRCNSGQIFATASSPARIAALRCPKSLPLIAARFGRITTSAYLSSS